MSAHFTESELACPHCGQNYITDAFVEKLERLRTKLGFPLPVNSGSRCPTHNQEVSSTGPRGPHTLGAVDIGVYGDKAYWLVKAALELGFRGIGVKQTGPRSGRFIHLDDVEDAEHPRPWVWSY